MFLASLATGCGGSQGETQSGNQCGSAPEDPHRHNLSSRDPDASCRACPTPQEVPSACEGDDGDAVSSAVSERLSESDVILEGTLQIAQPPNCEGSSSNCACDSTCTAALELAQPDAPGAPVLLLQGGNWPWQKETLAQSKSSSAGLILCRGGESALCCPFELDPESHSLSVEVHGSLQLVESSSHGEKYGVVVDDICLK